MGVCGCGKTEVGKQVAEDLAWPFFEADSFHPEANIKKLSAGIPLQDEDRIPWLRSIRDQIETCLTKKSSAIFTCSALKAAYRQILKNTDEPITFIHLTGPYDLLKERLRARKRHFMNPSLLDDQLKTLEVPEDAISIEIGDTVSNIAQNIVDKLDLLGF